MSEQGTVYTVSQLNLEARLIMEECFHTIWITVEISNLAKPSSGHLYFSLKDERAQIRCAFFRNNHRRLPFNVENGQQVLLQAQVSIYEAQGSYQLIVQHMEIAGTGALQVAFEQLKSRLEKEGLFSPAFKKKIPTLPKTIGVVTSPSGAAVRDILKILKRRFTSIPIIIYPTLVQGNKAAPQITAAIEMANIHATCDVLIIARGGGSLEDLWPFNEEVVARAIFHSNIPVVTGIGHETDFTIADFVADQRASTPSAAAEYVSPNKTEWLQQFNVFYQRLRHILYAEIKHLHTHLYNLSKRLQHPGKRLLHYRDQLTMLTHRLTTAAQHDMKYKYQALQTLSQSLHTLSPLNTLDRGFAIVTRANTDKIIRQAGDVKPGEKIHARLAKGSLDCYVEFVDTEK